MWASVRSLRRKISYTRQQQGGLLHSTPHELKGYTAIEAYERQLKDGSTPGVHVLVAALKACAASKDLKRGTRIHSYVVSSVNSTNIFVLSTLVDMYAKCGSMSEARRVFDTIKHPNVVSWTVLIWGYTQDGEFHKALQVFSRMHDVVPNAWTFVAVLKACTGLAGMELKVDALKNGRKLHFEISERGLVHDPFVASALVDMYAKCGSMKDAKDVFDQMPKHDIVSWTAVIHGYSRSGDGELALQLFSRMQDEGFVPDGRTFVAALNACACVATKEETRRNECLSWGISIHGQIMKLGYERDIFVASSLVDMYTKCGSMRDAKLVFDRMKQRNSVSWTSIMLGYAQSEEPELALEYFSRMCAEGILPNSWTYVAVLKACGSMAEREEADHELLKVSALQKGREIHSELAKAGLDLSDVFVGNTLLDMYAKCGSMTDARNVFNRMAARSVVSWNAMMMGYAEAGEGERALELFRAMKEQGFAPDVLTYVSVLKACSVLAALDTGRRIHNEVTNSAAENDILVKNSLVNLYGKCGSLDEARKVFDSVKDKDLVTWSALITGYACRGKSEEAFQLFARMQNEERLHPDGVTFLSILTACSHAGLVDKGKEFFHMMRSDYGLYPAIEHYTCMVDLLGRANHLQEAIQTVSTMPYEPNSTVWMTVLGACRKWKNVTIGRQAFDELVQLDKKDSAAYVLMADTYAAAGMWEESSRINRIRTSVKAWKKPGLSWWIDSFGAVHRFGAGDNRHPQSSEIIKKLNEIVIKMKEEGYEAETESVVYDISDDAKWAALCAHSERLAIGCAIVNTCPGTEIRIVKNLRVCEDCHKATAVISRIEKRVVVCRDATRFHVFKDGNCSCGGFW